jgi:hypothetical protein
MAGEDREDSGGGGVSPLADEPGDCSSTDDGRCDARPSARLPPHLQAELEQALEEADREEGISADDLFAELKARR